MHNFINMITKYLFGNCTDDTIISIRLLSYHTSEFDHEANLVAFASKTCFGTLNLHVRALGAKVIPIYRLYVYQEK